MAIPNNPELNEQWTNDETGVTYQWDGERWFIVSTEISDLEDKYVNRSGDTMTGGLTLTDANKLTFTKEDDSLQFGINPNVNIDYFTNIYAFEGDGIRFRVSQNQSTAQGDYDTLISLSGETNDIGGVEYRGKLALNRVRVPGTPDQATNKWYVDTADNDLQGQIDTGLETQGEILENIETLNNKVNALEGSVIDATWSYEADNRAPRDGEFGLRANGVPATTWASAQQILISFIDSTGETYTFDKITVNDVIRIGAADGTSAEYKVTGIITPGTYTIEHLRSSGTPTDELEYSFTFLSAFDPEGLATIDYVDAQDALKVSKAGDTIQGPLNFDSSNSTVEVSGDTGSMRRRYIKVRGNNQLEFVAYPGQDNTGSKTAFELKADPGGNPELKLNYLIDPSQNGHAVNLRYANANYLKLTGGTVTGNVIVQGGTIFMRDADGNEKARIQGSNGFIRSYDQVRVDRTADANAFEARRSGTTNATIKSTGAATFKTSVTKDGKELATEEYVDNATAVAGNFVATASKDATAATPIEIYRSGSTYYIKGGVA